MAHVTIHGMHTVFEQKVTKRAKKKEVGRGPSLRGFEGVAGGKKLTFLLPDGLKSRRAIMKIDSAETPETAEEKRKRQKARNKAAKRKKAAKGRGKKSRKRKKKH